MFKGLLALVMTVVSGGVRPTEEVKKPVEETPVVEVVEEVPAMIETVKEVIEYVVEESTENVKEAVEYAVVNGVYNLSDAAAQAYDERATESATYDTKDLWINVGIGFICRNLIYIIKQVTAQAGYTYLLADYDSFIALFDKDIQTFLKEIFDNNKSLYTYVIGIIAKLNLGA